MPSSASASAPCRSSFARILLPVTSISSRRTVSTSRDGRSAAACSATLQDIIRRRAPSGEGGLALSRGRPPPRGTLPAKDPADRDVRRRRAERAAGGARGGRDSPTDAPPSAIESNPPVRSVCLARAAGGTPSRPLRGGEPGVRRGMRPDPREPEPVEHEPRRVRAPPSGPDRAVTGAPARPPTTPRIGQIRRSSVASAAALSFSISPARPEKRTVRLVARAFQNLEGNTASVRAGWPATRCTSASSRRGRGPTASSAPAVPVHAQPCEPGAVALRRDLEPFVARPLAEREEARRWCPHPRFPE